MCRRGGRGQSWLLRSAGDRAEGTLKELIILEEEAGLGELTWSDTRFRRNTLDLQGQMAQKANVIAGGGPTCALKPGRNRALPPSGVASAGNSSSPSSQASESPP